MERLVTSHAAIIKINHAPPLRLLGNPLNSKEAEAILWYGGCSSEASSNLHRDHHWHGLPVSARSTWHDVCQCVEGGRAKPGAGQTGQNELKHASSASMSAS
eukprot:1324555-Rhodomonas_salina.1